MVGRKHAKSREDTLGKISCEVLSCSLCGLARTRTNAVPGEGSTSAKIMLIGEAPGKSEDKSGRPFVGSAGKILDASLKKAGILRSEVFITNVVKCRPPANRVPHDDEIKACRMYLERQISIIKPRIICILGRTAYSTLLGGKSITSSRGKIIKQNGQRYFLTLHPAAIMYNRGLRLVLESDFKKLADEFSLVGMEAATGDSLAKFK